jgi:serine/threonine protein kinase
MVVRDREVTPSRPLPEPGMVLGAYRLLAVLGEGSVGRVYAAEHVRLGRKVALKMIRPELGDHPKAIERFFGEARAVNQIAHENIVGITDFIDEAEYPAHYIMDHLEGRTLAERLADQGPLDVATARSIGLQLLSALEAVHAQGIVHRDLKPANIFLVDHGGQLTVKLLDFGVAKLSAFGSEGGPSNRTLSTVETMLGDLIGTPRYMAPEQTRGLVVDHRADIYAFGIILYEMLTGHTPFESEELTDMLAMHQTALPTRPSMRPGSVIGFPPEIEALIMQCLQKLVADRPQTVSEVNARLESADRPLPKKRWPIAVGVGAALLALIAAIVWISIPVEPEVVALPLDRPAPRPAPPPAKLQAPEPPPETAALDDAPAPIAPPPLAPPASTPAPRLAKKVTRNRVVAPAPPAAQKAGPKKSDKKIDTTETLNPFGDAP